MPWQPGQQISWNYRRPSWRLGDAEYLDPMTVVRDDQRGLVAWLAPGTEVLRRVLPTGENPRSAPGHSGLSLDRAQARGRWRGAGILRIAPAGARWSAWAFWDELWAFTGWYINLEAVHRRQAHAVLSCDHVLDVWIDPEGRVEMKDEDELAAAVEQDLLTAQEAQRIQEDAQAAIQVYRLGAFPFDEPWPMWRPDPNWKRPALPPDATW